MDPFTVRCRNQKKYVVLRGKKMENVPRDSLLEKIKVKLSHKATP